MYTENVAAFNVFKIYLRCETSVCWVDLDLTVTYVGFGWMDGWIGSQGDAGLVLLLQQTRPS